MSGDTRILEKLQDLIGKAEKAGADAADAIFVGGTSLSVSQRLGNPEDLNRSEDNDVGLRVFVGRKQAVVSSSDVGDETLSQLAEQAVAMARAVPDDEFCGLADPESLVGATPDLEECDSIEPTAEELMALAAEAEDAARAVTGVTNSEGASASWSRSSVALAASNGLARTRQGSRHSIGVSVLAGEGTGMERDYDFDTSVFADDLEKPSNIGRRAGERAVERLNPRKVETTQVPVFYDPRISGSILGHLSGAINGSGIARGTSFLKDKMGEQIFSDAITVVDDPLRKRGLRSKPFDGEGVATERRNIIENGQLTTWLLDCRSARQLGLKTTGHAARGVSAPPSPSPTNLYMEPGDKTPEELFADVKEGFYATELIGMGVNGVTGDYSRGASGFWIENGELAYPVSELTIASNLNDMFKQITAASDLEFKYGTNAPTLRIDGMTVAGK